MGLVASHICTILHLRSLLWSGLAKTLVEGIVSEGSPSLSWPGRRGGLLP